MDSRFSKCMLIVFSINVSIAFGQFEVSVDHVLRSNATFSGLVSSADPLAVAADPALANAATFDLFVDTPTDILLFDAELNVTAGSLYLAPEHLGLNTATQPSSSLTSVFPQVSATSYIATPGTTVAANANQLDGIGTTFTHFDVSNDGGQNAFPFGRITLIPDANGNASAELTGTLQTRSDDLRNVPHDVFSFQLGSTPSRVPTSFEDALKYRPNQTFIREVSQLEEFDLPSVVSAANDTDRFPDGVTMFVANNTADLDLPEGVGLREGRRVALENLDYGDFFVVDGFGSGELGWSPTDLESMVPGEGDSATLESLTELAFELRHGEFGLSYGGGNIVRSHQVDNGWVHIVDAFPNAIASAVPEPSSHLISLLACFGFFVATKNRRKR